MSIELVPVTTAGDQKPYLTDPDDESWQSFFKWAKITAEYIESDLMDDFPTIKGSAFWTEKMEVSLLQQFIQGPIKGHFYVSFPCMTLGACMYFCSFEVVGDDPCIANIYIHIPVNVIC